MIKTKLLTILFATAIAILLILPLSAQTFNTGVIPGQFVRYGNFIGNGPGAELFNEYDWLMLEVTKVSEKEVTLLSTSHYKNGTAIPGNGTISIWNIQFGTENGISSTQGPIIASDLNQGDPIPPPNTYVINRTESRTYLGVNRQVNVLEVLLSTPDYNSTLTYIYDKTSGMLLESNTQTVMQGVPQPIITVISYSIIETNIFDSTSTPPIINPANLATVAVITVIVIITIVTLILLRNRRKHF